jgi:hypothetical protein
LKKIINNDDKLVSIINRSIKKTELMKYITNLQLRQDIDNESIYYVIIEVKFEKSKSGLIK